MNEWTKGPWEVGQDRRGTTRVFAGNSEIVRALSSHGLRRLSAKERLGNMHLVATAPELYDALEMAEEELSDLPDDDGTLAAKRRQINAALVKARGEQ